jgi:hypothetical protein
MKFNEIKKVVVAFSIINNERFFVIKLVYFTLFLYGIIPTMIFNYFPTYSSICLFNNDQKRRIRYYTPLAEFPTAM